MQIKKNNLHAAEQAGVLERGQAEALWRFLAAAGTEAGPFTAAHMLYYLGGLLAIGAMTLFMTLGWLRLGGWGLVGLALAYGVVGMVLLRYFLYRQRLPTPAAIIGALVVAVIPVGVFGLQQALGLWPARSGYSSWFFDLGWRYLYMELATLLGGVILLWRYRLPFMVMPVAVALWFLSMTLTSFLPFDGLTRSSAHVLHCWLSMGFGVALLLLALWVDVRSRRIPDYAFWLYVSGLLSFWIALNLYDFSGAWWKLGYCLINLGLLAISAVLRRRLFAVFGAFGILRYVGYLAFEVFEDSLLFSLSLTAVGVLVIFAGMLWQRYETRIGNGLRRLLPATIRDSFE